MIADYARSAVFMAAVRESGQLGDAGRGPVVLPMHDAPAEAMALFLEGVSSQFPTSEDLARGLGLDSSTVTRLRERYLTPAQS